MELAELDAQYEPMADPNKGLMVTFFYYTDKDDEETTKQGRPVFKDYEYLRCIVAGDRTNVIERPATPYDRKRFAAQYKRFKASEEQKPSGFPLSEWTQVSKAQIEELKYFNVFTVEQLAEVPDNLGQQFPFFHDLKRKANSYLTALKEEAPLLKMQAELQERDDKIAVLERQLQEVVEDLKKSKKEK